MKGSSHMSNNFARQTTFNAETEPTVTRSWVGSDAAGYSRDGYETLDALKADAANRGDVLRTVPNPEDNDQWPYSWAYTLDARPLSLFVYAEGDLTETAYVDDAERAEAVRLYSLTDEEYAQSVAEEQGHDDASDGMGAAIVAWINERDGHAHDAVTEQRVCDALEHYRGKFESDAEYCEEAAISMDAPTMPEYYQDQSGDPLPEWLRPIVSINWDAAPLVFRNTPGMVFEGYSGHYFTTGD